MARAKKTRAKKVEVKQPDAVKVHAIVEDNATLDAMGFEKRDRLFSLTQRDGERTDRGWRMVRDDFLSLPLAQEGLEAFKSDVKDEETREVLVQPGSILMHPTGEIQTPSDLFTLTPEILKEIVARFAGQDGEVYAGSHLASMKPHTRSMEFNRLARFWDKSSNPTPFKLASRNGSGRSGRTAFRFSSEAYKAFPPDKIASVLQSKVSAHPDGDRARVQVSYDGDKSQVDVLWFNSHDIDQSGCGDLFQFGVRVISSEMKRGALKVQLVVYANNCLNYIIVEVPTKSVAKQRHIGKVDMEARLDVMVDEAMNQAEPMLSRWHEATRENLETVYGVTGPDKVFGALYAKGFGVVAGVTPEDNIKMLVDAYNFDPSGLTRAGAVNAITRMAHVQGWKGSKWTTSALEENAGELLYVNVLNN